MVGVLEDDEAPLSLTKVAMVGAMLRAVGGLLFEGVFVVLMLVLVVVVRVVVTGVAAVTGVAPGGRYAPVRPLVLMGVGSVEEALLVLPVLKEGVDALCT